MVDTYLRIFLEVQKKGFEKFKETANHIKRTTEEIGQLQRATTNFFQRFDMNILSLMFGGWAIQRVFAGMFRSLFDTYSLVHEQQGELNNQVNRAIAAWTFFKYSLIDALTQSELFVTLISFVVAFVDKLSEWIQLHPQAAQWILILSGVSYLLGTILITLGFLGQSIYGVGLLFKMLSLPVQLLWEVWALFLTWLLKRLGVLGLVGLKNFTAMVGGIIGAIYWIYKLQDVMGGWGEFFKSVIRGVRNAWYLLHIWMYELAAKTLESISQFLNKFNLTKGLASGLWNAAKSIRAGSSLYETEMMNVPEWLTPKKGYAEFGGLLPKYPEKTAGGGETINYDIDINIDNVLGDTEDLKRAIVTSLDDLYKRVPTPSGG